MTIGTQKKKKNPRTEIHQGRTLFEQPEQRRRGLLSRMRSGTLWVVTNVSVHGVTVKRST